MVDVSKYMKIFIAEAQENIQDMNKALLDLEKNPGKRELLDEMFRYAHTIKGGAASMDFHEISTLAHEMESLMDKFRSQNINPDSSVIDILFETLDLLETLISDVVKKEKSEIEITPLVNKIKAISIVDNGLKPELIGEGQAPVESEKEAPIKKRYNIQIKIKLKDDCVLKSVRASMVLKKLSEIGEIVNTAPEIRDIENEKFPPSFIVFLVTKENEEKIRKVVESVSEIERADILTASSPSKKVSTPIKTKTKTVRVDIERLDKLMNLVGELVIDKIRLIRINSIHEIPELSAIVSHLDRLTTDIQEEVMQARLVPVDLIFNRFPRMVRDMAKVAKKKIDLTMEGTEIEVDRTILDKISDPLIHLIRNAVDHGVEPAPERKNAGKPETSSIKLAASREKQHVVIEISDDGKGIDPDQVLDMAIKKGVVSSEEGVNLSDEDKLMLICAPGFSTAKKVTNVSGRGVGMDVVQTTMQSLGGAMIIDSKKGLGTKFTLKLPLTTAIARSLLVKVQQETYVVPLANVQEIVSVKAKDVETVKGAEVISLRGKVVPLIRVDKTLKLNLSQETKSEFFALIVEVGNKRAGLVVDRLLGQQEIVIKSLDAQMKEVKGYAGATILGDGNAAFILDVGSFL